ncbi:BnaA02g07150D [Brassica napus]|uniref:BnaA02g07150D protein n=1 Tax=Brassica napus TaxID=3708 RepID=A0A078H742_BRANA|nr:BnaA02g07150D [Brassica napus]
MSNNYEDGGVYYDPDETIDNNKRQKRGDGTSAAVPGSTSSWIMYEYSLPDENTFQELVLCKIRKISNSKDEEVEAVDVTHDAEDGTGELVERFARTGLDDQQTTEKYDQQEPPMYAPSQSSDPPARLGNKSLYQ